jgi:hypothetical protein
MHQFEIQSIVPGYTPALLGIELGVAVSSDDNA